jgi:predicted secreted protein
MMKNIRLVICAILFSAVMFSSLLAGDFAEMKFIGFSEDDKYLAFEEFGEWDDHSSGSYATTYFVDVAKNVFAVSPSVFDYSINDDKHTGRFSEAARMARYKTSVAAAIKRFKIIPGNTGKLVVAHLSSDLSYEKPELKESRFYKSDGTQTEKMVPFYLGGSLLPADFNPYRVVFTPFDNPINPQYDEFYELTLDLTDSKEPCSLNGEVKESASLIELTLRDNTKHEEIKPQILQKDKSIPESRHCAEFYQIEQVYYYEGRLAVFLNYDYGYPRDSKRYMVVTGKINK